MSICEQQCGFNAQKDAGFALRMLTEKHREGQMSVCGPSEGGWQDAERSSGTDEEVWSCRDFSAYILLYICNIFAVKSQFHVIATYCYSILQ